MSFVLTPRRGWRTFLCDDCGHHWHEATRDCHSPSGDGCPVCYAWCHVVDAREDASIPVDQSLNVTWPWEQRIMVVAQGRRNEPLG